MNTKKRCIFFRPNGSVAFLYKSIGDYKRKKNRKCVRREKLEGSTQFSILFEHDELIHDTLKTESEITNTESGRNL